jgi:hypothetical protein
MAVSATSPSLLRGGFGSAFLGFPKKDGASLFGRRRLICRGRPTGMVPPCEQSLGALLTRISPLAPSPPRARCGPGRKAGRGCLPRFPLKGAQSQQSSRPHPLASSHLVVLGAQLSSHYDVPASTQGTLENSPWPQNSWRIAIEGSTRWRVRFDCEATDTSDLSRVNGFPGISDNPRQPSSSPNPRLLMGVRLPLTSLRRSAAYARAVGFRPLYFPSSIAFATPSRCRSSGNPRSNSAMAPSIVIISLPVGLLVSIVCPPILSMMRPAPRRSSSLPRRFLGTPPETRGVPCR